PVSPWIRNGSLLGIKSLAAGVCTVIWLIPEDTNMFSTLESTWDKSVHRRWTALASFTVQAFGLSLLLLIPLLTIQSPPKVQWLEAPIFTPPAGPAPVAQQPRPISSSTTVPVSNREGQLQQPPAIPSTISITDLNEPHIASAPNLDEIAVTGGTNTRGRGITG